jgi:hypothetical protein
MLFDKTTRAISIGDPDRVRRQRQNNHRPADVSKVKRVGEYSQESYERVEEVKAGMSR